MKEVIVNAIEAVVINDDQSNEERTDFVYSLMRNAGNDESDISYFKEKRSWILATTHNLINSGK